MALSSILSLGLHLTIFLFFYYGLPFSKINDRKETTIPLIFEEELEVSNKTNLKKNEKFNKPNKKKQINTTIKNSPKPKPKKLISEKTDKNTEKLPLKPVIKPKQKNNLLISFVMKKKIGNAVKRNKIRRKLKAIVQKLLKKKGAINRDYTYIVFGKSNAYSQKQDVLLPLVEKSFSKLKK